ncbi:MAG: hypothetical protein Q8Q26_05265 [Pseudorhodobacter sp.]|nr:hypothetical protein [Pseudorhodobacter sp.]
MILVATPSVLLPGTGSDGKQMVALVALFAGLLTLVEYNATYPGLIEFRDAPPFNRTRFLILFAMVFALTVIARSATSPTTLTTLVEALGALIGRAMDFPFSPVRQALLMMADGASDAQAMALRTAAGMAYLISLVGLGIFVVMLKRTDWPAECGGFNVWVNLPTFDPTTGGDVVSRLKRDARINVALGFLLPFLTPVVVKISSSGFEPLTLTSPQTLIWTITAWAFLPASLFMRGIAMSKIAVMIRDKRRGSVSAQAVGYIAA